MRTVSCGLPVQKYRRALLRLRGDYSSLVLMIDGILEMLLWYDTIANAGQIEIKKINLEANLQVVITMFPSTYSNQIHLRSRPLPM